MPQGSSAVRPTNGLYLYLIDVPDSWPLMMGQIGCPETSVRNLKSSLRNNPEERSFHLLGGGRLLRLRGNSFAYPWEF